MKLYVPDFLPGDIVAFKHRQGAIIGKIEYSQYHPDSGFVFSIEGWTGNFTFDKLTLVPNGQRLKTEFQVK